MDIEQEEVKMWYFIIYLIGVFVGMIMLIMAKKQLKKWLLRVILWPFFVYVLLLAIVSAVLFPLIDKLINELFGGMN